jgi:hypothetical protein
LPRDHQNWPRAIIWRSVLSVTPGVDIWYAANLMLRRYGDKTIEESVARADELAVPKDYNGRAVWLRITDAISQLANIIPAGPLH